MPLTNAEKQRRYREKRDRDHSRRAEYLQKEKKRYVKNKSAGAIQLVEDMPERKHGAMKKKWKNDKRKLRQRQKDVLKQIPMSPPQSPEDIPMPSRQKLQGNKKMKMNKNKRQRYIDLLKKGQKLAERKSEMYRKRWERLQKHLPKSNFDTPRSKTRKLLQHFSSKTVRKTLIFHNALVDQMAQACKEKTHKNSISAILAGSILKKYKCRSFAQEQLGMHPKRGNVIKMGTIRSRLQNKIRHFFERDDISRITTGQKRTITRQKIKKQRRLLCDTMRNVYKKYMAA